MHTVNLLQAKTHLSSLLDAIEQGEESEILIARDGRPVAKLVALGELPSGKRIGVAKDLFVVPDNIDFSNAEVARLFLGHAE